MASTTQAARSLAVMRMWPVRVCALAMFSAALLATDFFSPPMLNAQEATESPTGPSQTPPADQAPRNDLTEGLLDLLTEPSKTGKSQMPAEPASTPAVDRKPQSESSDKPAPAPASSPRPADQDVMGEDIGTLGKHPLAEVQAEMETAALWLHNLTPVDKTQGVQREIVARLDRLISELEQQQPQAARSSSNASASDTKQTKQASEAGDDSQQPGSKSELAASEPADKSSPQEPTSRDPSATAQAGENGSESGPSQPGLSAPSSQRRPNVVDLNDPTALQRSAWGSLPDRVRDQMQSRMVERFLPSYREDIEAYYRALAK